MPKVFSLNLPRLLLCTFASMGLCNCTSTSLQTMPPNDGTYWSATAGIGDTKIVISLQEQRVGLFRGHKLIGLSPISSGREGYDTHPGTYKVTEKDIDHRSSIYGAFVDQTGNVVIDDVNTRSDQAPPGTRFVGADMRYFMRFNGAIGMHQGYLPGYPASHGCIRLAAKMAPLFFAATPHGSRVEVHPNANLLAHVPEPVSPSVKAPCPTARAVDPIATDLRQSIASEPVSTQNIHKTPVPKKTGETKPKPQKTTRKNKTATLYLEGYGPQ